MRRGVVNLAAPARESEASNRTGSDQPQAIGQKRCESIRGLPPEERAPSRPGGEREFQRPVLRRTSRPTYAPPHYTGNRISSENNFVVFSHCRRAIEIHLYTHILTVTQA